MDTSFGDKLTKLVCDLVSNHLTGGNCRLARCVTKYSLITIYYFQKLPEEGSTVERDQNSAA